MIDAFWGCIGVIRHRLNQAHTSALMKLSALIERFRRKEGS